MDFVRSDFFQNPYFNNFMQTIAMAIQRDNSSCVLGTVVSRWGLLHVTHTIQIQLIYFLNNVSIVAVLNKLPFLKVFWKYAPVLEFS
jgi:hypothetical protein